MTLVTRPLEGRDAGEVHALVRRWEAHWGVPRVSTQERAMEWLTAPSVSMSSDTLGYWQGEHLIAYGSVSFVPSSQRRQLTFLDGRVDPGHLGRGIGRDLLSWQAERARERMAEMDTLLPCAIRATTWEWIEDAANLLNRFGLVEVRRFDEMSKTLGAYEPVDPPTAVEIVPWDRFRDEEALLANNRAFVDHWGASPMSTGNWLHLLDSIETRLETSFHALADGRIVGMSVAAHHPLDHQVTGHREGWIRILSVDPAHRGQGIGRALLTVSHNAFIDAGYTHSALRVDSLSQTGANHLYESAGYEVLRTSLIHELTIED